MNKRDIKISYTKLRSRLYLKKWFSLLFSPIAILFRVAGFRFSSQGSENRIGHLIFEPLYMDLRSREDQRFGKRFILLIPFGLTANSYVLEKLPKKFIVIKNPFLCKLLSPLKSNPFCAINMESISWGKNKALEMYKYTHLISSSRPFLDLPSRESARFQKLLKDLGISSNGWYVCLHNREKGYSKYMDDDVTDFRNGSIKNFLLTVNYISSLGGTVIRMGDSSMTPFPKTQGLVDYVHSSLKSEENDIFLSANCRFFLGNTTGANLMAGAQGVPIVGVNLAAMGYCKFWGPNDIGVPKLYFRESNDKPIPFKEIFESNLANLYKTYMFNEAGVYLKESTEDEILEAVKQMFEQLSGKFEESFFEKELQYKFNNLFNTSNCSFHSQTKISSYFLRKHRNLL